MILFSGKTGAEISRTQTPGGGKTFFMPQLVEINGTNYAVVGTGGPTTSGALSLVPLTSLYTGNLVSTI